MSDLKLYQFTAGETDWVAAYSQAEAATILKSFYELNDSDLDGTEVSEVDPETITVNLDDEFCKTAGEVIATMKLGAVICSTAY